MARRCRNWGRWGADDVRGTLNHLDDAARAYAATVVRRGVSFFLAQRLRSETAPRSRWRTCGCWRRRTNPVHTCSTRVRPGDVLGSGTCGNGGCLAELWGRNGRLDPPPLRPGDVVRMTVGGLGTIENRVVAGRPAPATAPARPRPRTRP